jgi:hypothetical protein
MDYADRRSRPFFPWYNTEHHHNGLGLLTPHDVHFDLAEQRVAERAAMLTTAYAAHPERFPAGRPRPAAAPIEVWINPPKPRALEEVAHSLNSRTGGLVLIDRLRSSPRSCGVRPGPRGVSALRLLVDASPARRSIHT